MCIRDRAAFDHNIPFILSTVSTSSIETISEITEGKFWFQLYHPAEESVTKDLLKRAEFSGCKVLIILADQLSSAVDIADMARKKMYKEATGNLTMPSEFGVNSTSAGDMFMGALLPGLVLVGLYMLYILVAAYLKADLAPAVPLEGKRDKSFVVKVLLSLIPP